MQESQVWEHSFKSVSTGQIIDHQIVDLLSKVLSSFHYPSFARLHQNAEGTLPFCPRLLLDLWNSLLLLCQPISGLSQEGPVLCVSFLIPIHHL